MKCPRCKGPELSQFHLAGGVVVDSCEKCSGVWFEKGEIGQYARFSTDIPDLKEALKKGSPGLACPHCAGRTMVEVPYTRDSATRVDYCDGCGGTWLDGGELDALDGMAESLDNLKLRLGRAVFDLRAKLGGHRIKACPKCAAPTLQPFRSSENIEVDFCSKCKGIWLEKGETAAYVELSSDIPDLDAARRSARKTACACPDCAGAKLEEIRYSPKHDLLVDYCAGCGGVWLDAGELDKLETISAGMESAAKKLGRVFAELDKAGYKAL